MEATVVKTPQWTMDPYLASNKRKSPPLDIASNIGIEPGARIQVKWFVDDDDKSEYTTLPSGARARTESKCISVWWNATVHACEETYTLTPEQKEITGLVEDVVQVYELDYDPVPEMEYAERTSELIAFVSNWTMIRLPSGGVLRYKADVIREGNKCANMSNAMKVTPVKKNGRNGLSEIKAVESHLKLAKKAKGSSSANLLRAERNLQMATNAFESAMATFQAARRARKAAYKALDAAKKEDEEAEVDVKEAERAVEAVNSKWEIIDVDIDDNASALNSKDRTNKDSKRSTGIIDVRYDDSTDEDVQEE